MPGPVKFTAGSNLTPNQLKELIQSYREKSTISAAENSSLFSHYRNKSMAKESNSYKPQSVRTRGEIVEKEDCSLDLRPPLTERQTGRTNNHTQESTLKIQGHSDSSQVKLTDLQKLIVIELSLHGTKPSTSIKVRLKADGQETELKEKGKLCLKKTPDLKEV